MPYKEDYWSQNFKNLFIQDIDSYAKYFEKIFPVFNFIDEEAAKLENEELSGLNSFPGYADTDPSGIKEMALDRAFAYYLRTKGIQHSVINLFVLGLYNLLEQQFYSYLNRKSSKSEKGSEKGGKKCEEFRKLMSKAGIDIQKFQSYKKINELRLAATAIKLTFGSSRDELKKVRPDFSLVPESKNVNFIMDDNINLISPLGENIFIKEHDVKDFIDAVKDFWTEFEKEAAK